MFPAYKQKNSGRQTFFNRVWLEQAEAWGRQVLHPLPLPPHPASEGCAIPPKYQEGAGRNSNAWRAEEWMFAPTTISGYLLLDPWRQIRRYYRLAWVAHSRCDTTFDGCLTCCSGGAAGGEPTSSLAAAWMAPQRFFPLSHRRRRSAAPINSHQRRSACERLPQLMSLQLMSLISWQTPCKSGGRPGARQSVTTCTSACANMHAYAHTHAKTRIAMFP